MSIRLVAAVRERRSGLDAGPRVRPHLDRWRAPAEPVDDADPRHILLTVDDAPEGPRVLVTMDRDAQGPWVSADYVDAVRKAGGTAWLLPPGPLDPEVLLAEVDALLVTGGAFDIHPSHYGAAVEARLDRTDEDRTGGELALCAAALAGGVPVLGVCGGMQALAVAAGGTLVQDLPPEPTHEQPTDPATPWHPVRLAPPLDAWWGASEIRVNSTHHQAVAHPGRGLVAAGWSPDGVVEAVWAPDHPFALGVQGHPERLGDEVPYTRLLTAARRRAHLRARARP